MKEASCKPVPTFLHRGAQNAFRINALAEVRVLLDVKHVKRCRHAMATSMCPFYRNAVTSVQAASSARQQTQALPLVDAPWCAHLFSPVTRHVTSVSISSPRKLSCGGDICKCQVIASQRPKL